jgi:fatty acid desaturase
VTAVSLQSKVPSAHSTSATAELLSTAQLGLLNERCDGPGLKQLACHLAVVLVGALLWGLPLVGSESAALVIPWPLRLLGLLLLGLGLAFSFCAMHESGHRTAFASRQLNDTVAWWAGVLSFYNADFYRRYHQWHHRYTHLPGLDPELESSPPSDLASYLLELSAIPWWMGKIRGHWAGLRGDFAGQPYIPSEAIPAVRRSIQLQCAVYGVLLVASIPAANGLLFWFWLLPLAVAQPLLRFVLLAEHGGCPFEPDGRRNTRTTLTLAPLRLLMWQMPFHTEHHLYPSLPFHALARAHGLLAPSLQHGDRGYLAVHRRFLNNLSALGLPAQPAQQPTTAPAANGPDQAP